MNITVLCVGKIKEKYFTDAVNEYKKWLSRFAKFNIIEIPDEKIPDNASQKEEERVKQTEGEKILAKLPTDAYVISMCIEGKEVSSVELAKKISDIAMQKSHIVFILGGSLGLFDKLKSRSDFKMSFGKITLPHQLMRVVLCEQIYRAFKINRNESYHK